MLNDIDDLGRLGKCNFGEDSSRPYGFPTLLTAASVLRLAARLRPLR